MKNRAVITGVGVLSPIGNTLEAVTHSLKNGLVGITRFDHENVDSFDSKVAGHVKDFDPKEYINPKEARRMDRFTQLAVAAAAMAVDDSGLVIENIDRMRAGVIVGSGIGGIETLEKQYEIFIEKGSSRISPFMIPMMIINMASGQIAIQHGFQGPNFSIATACATATHCIGESFKMIQAGRADVIICGGSEAALTNTGLSGFCAMKALSTKWNDEPERASRPFDKERDGFVIAEGAGIVILESLDHAKKRRARIYGEITGYGATCDAYHMTAPLPDGSGAASAMSKALDDAGISYETVDYINAHGTSTMLNDLQETQAVKAVFKDKAAKVHVSSTKSMTGHMLGAAGGVELIACLTAMNNGFIPPTMNYEFPDPDCDLDYVPNEAREGVIKTAMSNSLGFGGHNASLIVKKV